MSRQLNFFATRADKALFHQRLLELFPGLQWITPEREGPAQLTPEPFDVDDALTRSGTAVLVPAWALRSLRQAGGDDASEATILPRENPVIEYTLPAERADGTLVVGRVYWAYAAPVPAQQLRPVDTMFVWLRANARRLPFDQRFRILPHAAASARRLDFGFDIVEPNPFAGGTG